MRTITMMILCACLLFASCEKKEPLIEGKVGTVVLLSNNTACTLFIQLDSGEKLEPVNRESLESFMTSGRRVTVNYRQTFDFPPQCDGTVVFIEDIR